jgi:hypothetical protein
MIAVLLYLLFRKPAMQKKQEQPLTAVKEV